MNNKGKFISYSTQKLWEHKGDKEIDEETEGQEESEKGASLKGALVFTNLWLKQNVYRKNKAMVGNEMLSLFINGHVDMYPNMICILI